MSIGIVASAMVPALENTATPVVTVTGGSVAGVALLSVTTGSWSPAPSSYLYQWQFDNYPVNGVWGDTGGSANTSTPTNIQGGNWRCRVTAVGVGGAQTVAYSNVVTLTLAAPVNTVAPVITSSGNGVAGSTTLNNTSVGTWSPVYTTVVRVWQRDGVDQPTGTGPLYTTSVNEGGTWRVKITASNAISGTGGSAVAYSNTIVLTQAPPGIYTYPVIGDPWIGQLIPGQDPGQPESVVLSCSSGVWSPLATSYAYQWYSSPGVQDPYVPSGATGNNTSTVVIDIAGNWKCLVTATNSGGSTAVYSNEVYIDGRPRNLTPPVVSPAFVVVYSGAVFTLTSVGTWRHAPNAATSYIYTWQWSYDGANWIDYPSLDFQTSIVPPFWDYWRCLVEAVNSYGSSGRVPSNVVYTSE